MDARTLLCVEPDEGAVEQIRHALEPYGFEVQSIPNGEAAVEWARHPRANADHRVGRTPQGRLRGLQQAEAGERAAAHPADPHLGRGDAADLRPAQEAEVTGRRIPAEAVQHRRAAGQGEHADSPAGPRGHRPGQRQQLPGGREPAGCGHLPGAVGRRQRHHGRGRRRQAGRQPVRPWGVRRRVRPGGRRRLRRHPEPRRDRAHQDRRHRRRPRRLPAPRAPRSGTTRRPAPRS